MKRLFHFTPAKVWLISSLILVIFIQVNCNAQNPAFHYKKIPDKYKISQPDQSSYEQKIDSLKGLAFDLTNSLPQGYVTDGSVDYTTYLQQGIQAHANVIFPNFPVMISPRGLTLISNSCLIFKEQSKLIMMPNSQSNYQAIRLNNLKNVTLYGPIIQGDRDQHKAAKGEWGMGIWIAGCDGVKIYNAHISDCWGDGIYIGKGI
ncbi:MAG: hypothetical protein JST32_22395, partial [Bacteroidetes bacterium]|nr:hypothetical protein [Bacteroidota bacterium]